MATQRHQILSHLAHLAVACDTLRLYHRNARRGDLDSIAESLKVNGQYRAIVVNAGTHTGRPNEILAGNHTFTAATEKLGWTHIAVAVIDVDDDLAERINLVDNSTSDKGGYDLDMLGEILRERPELTGTGYLPDDLDRLLDEAGLPEPIELPTKGKGTGKATKMDQLQWGFVQWGSTRVRITSEEVAAFDRTFAAFTDEHDTDVGFGFHLLGDRAEVPA